MKNIRIYQYQRGNHSIDHVIARGNVIFEGNAKQAKAEISRLKKQAKNKWLNTSTEDSLAEFVQYELDDLWVVDMDTRDYYRG
ncbi:MAG: hypothetical protein LBG17_04665 [Bacteroidales bacterium]|jgi:hypothetical protein|nr:hypothetical protein [Bacteroidales bacterium]